MSGGGRFVGAAKGVPYMGGGRFETGWGRPGKSSGKIAIPEGPTGEIARPDGPPVSDRDARARNTSTAENLAALDARLAPRRWDPGKQG